MFSKPKKSNIVVYALLGFRFPMKKAREKALMSVFENQREKNLNIHL
jgi:hypothetical protein